MKNLIYCKLGSYDYTHSCFPIVIAGWFHDGVYAEPIWLQEKGEILFEHIPNGKIDIKAADGEFLKHTGMKKIPNEVVCYLEDF